MDLYANDAVTPPLWASPTISPDSSFELVSGWDVAASLNQTQPLAPASPTSSMSQGSCATPSFARAPPKSKVTSEATYKASEERRKAERRFACKSEGCSMAFTRKESLSGTHLEVYLLYGLLIHSVHRPHQCSPRYQTLPVQVGDMRRLLYSETRLYSPREDLQTRYI